MAHLHILRRRHITLRELTIENPLLIEFRRSVRRFFGVSKHSAVNAMVLVISCLLYGLLLLITIANRTAMSPVAIVFLQTFLFCFLIPANLHGAIAGERERRSWDLLLASPISNLQIVVGKMLSGLAAVGTTALLMLPPLIISFAGDSEASLVKVIQAQMVSIGFAIALAAITMFISARSKRTYAAQLTTYAVLIVGLIVYWVFVEVATGGQGRQTLLFLHPFYAISAVWGYENNASSLMYNGLFHFLIFTAIAAVLLVVTVETLQIADGDEGRRR